MSSELGLNVLLGMQNCSKEDHPSYPDVDAMIAHNI